MIGQILGGSSPNVAIKYQMMIMVITFTASMLSLMITISLASCKSFDAYGKLLPVMVEKKGKRSKNNHIIPAKSSIAYKYTVYKTF